MKTAKITINGLELQIAQIFENVPLPLKQNYCKSIYKLIDHIERRYQKQVDQSNLANLQIMLKKHQIIRQKDEQIKSLKQQIQEIKLKHQCVQKKIDQIEKLIILKDQELYQKEQKTKAHQTKLMTLSRSLLILQQALKSTSEQRDQLTKINDQLEQEKQRYQNLIYKLRFNHYSQLENTEMMVKIKQKRLEQNFNQNIEIIQSKIKASEEKIQIQKKLRQKNIQIQCILLQDSSHTKQKDYRNFGIQTQILMVSRFSKQTSTFNWEIQQIIKQPQQKMEYQISFPLNSKRQIASKISSYQDTQKNDIGFQTELKQIQQQKAIIQVQQYGCNVKLEVKELSLQQMIQDIQKAKKKMQTIQQQKYLEIAKIYEKRPSRKQDIYKIQMLSTRINQLTLQLQKRKVQTIRQSQAICELNQQINNYQKISFCNKFVLQNQQNFKLKKPVSKTYSFFRRDKRKFTQTQTSQNFLIIDNQKQDAKASGFAINIDDLVSTMKSKSNKKQNSQLIKSICDKDHSKDLTRAYRKYSFIKNNHQL